MPCIWWTCDHTVDDGTGVRMAIWLVTWVVFAAILASVNFKRAKRRKERRRSGQLQQGDEWSYDSDVDDLI